MIGSVGVELDYVVRGNASITFVYFIAVSMLAVLAARFTYYAVRNGRANERDALASLWRSLAIAGGAAVLYALLGVLDVITTIGTPFRRGFLLAHVLGIVAAMQLLGREAGPDRGATEAASTRALLWPLGVGAALVVALGSAWNRDNAAVVLFEGISGLAFVTFGLSVVRAGLTTARVRGTVFDTLLRHLLPVLLFAAMIPITGLAIVLGTVGGVPVLDRTLVVHVEVVFVVMTATALMTATIRLRQNLAGL